MPELINDVDDKGKFVTRWATRCSRCRHSTKAEDPALPKAWESASKVGSDGRILTLCPECRK